MKFGQKWSILKKIGWPQMLLYWDFSIFWDCLENFYDFIWYSEKHINLKLKFITFFFLNSINENLGNGVDTIPLKWTFFFTKYGSMSCLLLSGVKCLLKIEFKENSSIRNNSLLNGLYSYSKIVQSFSFQHFFLKNFVLE